MDFSKSNRRASAFSLVELLTVIAIIAILAALLLPVLSKSQMRAKRIWCVSNLREIGIAFQSFAHDHKSRFPMTVPVNEGGSQEFVQNGYLVNGPFYFAFRHFQTLSNILVVPKILVCPADTRLAATNFVTLKNANVSYFVGVNAEYSRPASILAGDGNLAASPQSPTIVRSDATVRLQWTSAQHTFKGNLLFADGHVEEWGGSLNGNTIARAQNFVLPSMSPASGSSATGNSINQQPPLTTKNRAAGSAVGGSHTTSAAQTETSAQRDVSGAKTPTAAQRPPSLLHPLSPFPITLTPLPAATVASPQSQAAIGAETVLVRTNAARRDSPAASAADTKTNATQNLSTSDQSAKPSPGPLNGNWLWVLLLLVIVILTTLVKTHRKPTRR